MIRILLVDDQELVRAGFRVILNSEPGFEVVGEAANGAEAVELAQRLEIDVVCMDVEMPVMTGIEATRLITAGSHAGADAPAILILTTFGHESYLFEALAAGASGFLLKTSRAEQLIEAMRTLASGQALLSPDVTRTVIERIATDRDARSSDPVPPPGGDALVEAGLTERESEVMRLLARGLSNAEIAAGLVLGEATVKTHVSNILQKLGVRDRIQAVVWAHTHRILDE